MSQFIKNHIYLITLAISVLFIFLLGFDLWKGGYTDSDGYMRAIRLKHFIENPTFFEKMIYESNYPFGEINHWTRPMDILWLLCYLPFSLFLPLKDAIFMGGAFLSPLIKTAAAMTLVCGLKRSFNIYLALFGLIIFLNYPTGIYNAGRPDHHSLMNFWHICSLTLVIYWYQSKKDKYLLWLGIISALSVFTAIEGILLYAIILAYFTAQYVFKNASLFPALLICKSFCITLTICWLLNPPYQGWLYPDNGRISVLFVCLAWLILMGLKINNQIAPEKILHKILALTATGITILLILMLTFGKNIFSAPLSSEITEIWVRYINEMKPIHKQEWAVQCYFYGFSTCAVILNIFLIIRNIHPNLMQLNLYLCLPLYVLSFFAIRFANYNSVYCILPFVAYIEYIYNQFPHKLSLKENVPPYLWAILGTFFIQIFYALPCSLYVSQLKPQKTFSYQLCQNVRNIGGTLATNTFLGPKYIWSCDVNVIATPYHRNIEGILDNRHILAGRKDEEIIPLLLKHQVTQIVVFDKHQNEFDENDNALLYNRLIKHSNIPFYLEEIPSNITTAHHYRVKI